MAFSSVRWHPLALVAMFSCLSPPAFALPSFSSQTGVACTACHTVAFGPGLTSYGQQFKLNGYVDGAAKTVIPPVSVMVISSFTHTQTAQDGGAAPHFSPNNNSNIDQTSLFYAGRITQHVGALIQATYDGIAHRFAWDNVDIRYANTATVGTHDLVWGISANNSPTTQDLWNTTPAWSYPYVASGLAPTPAAAPQIEGALAQLVYGLTAYTMIDNLIYLEAGGYRTLPGRLLNGVGVEATDANPIHGVAPYWRVAVQKQQGSSYGSLGLFGIALDQYPGGDRSAGVDRYTDLGYDATYGYSKGRHALLFQATVIQELAKLRATQALGGADSVSQRINTTRLNLQYTFAQTWAASAGLFAIRGNTDTSLYAPAPVSGSASGSPNSRGWLAQLEYVPTGRIKSLWAPHLNLRLGLQYTYYTQFNGGGANYDGFGRSAHDNNTAFAFAWLAF